VHITEMALTTPLITNSKGIKLQEK